MCNDRTEAQLDRAGLKLGRRQFGALTGAGALAAMLPSAALAKIPLHRRDARIVTGAGTADAYFTAPADGRHPAVLIWPDIRGLRPAFRQMADRLAADGYAVLCVNPFYRWKAGPALDVGEDFADPPVRDRLMGQRRQLTRALVDADARAFIAYLDAQPEVDTARKMAVTGYCMGGEMAIFTAAARPDRVGAVGSFHGGGVGTDKPDSPHLLIPATQAAYLFAIADNDDKDTPLEKDRLRTVLALRAQWHEVEVYTGAMHGWCPPDGRAYDEAAAEKAWGRLLHMLKLAL